MTSGASWSSRRRGVMPVWRPTRRHGARQGRQKKLRELAQAIADALAADDLVRSGGRRWPRLHQTAARWARTARCAAIRAGADYGKSDIGHAERVNVEYVSPIRPGRYRHCRGAVPGDALADLLAFTASRSPAKYYQRRRRRSTCRLLGLPAPRGAGRDSASRRDFIRALPRAGRPGARREETGPALNQAGGGAADRARQGVEMMMEARSARSGRATSAW